MTSEHLDEYFASVFKPGATILTSGFKGGGKTHTAVAIAEQLIKGKYPSVGKVRVFTNVIFYHKVGGEVIEECPEGVTHITTMKELFPLLVDSMEKDHDVVNLMILDEAQFFISGDSNTTNSSIMMKEFLGIIRKFRLVVWFLTPSAMSIGPAFRNYLNDPKYPGNLTAKLKKDLGWNRRYIESNNLPYSPNELMLIKNFDSEPKVLRVPVTEWTKTRDTLKEGEYCYDHEASATFWMGDGFDWESFSRQIGGVSSMRILDVIRKFYSMPAQKTETPEEIRHRVEGSTAYRLVSDGMSYRKAAHMLNMSPETMQRRIRDAGYEVPRSQSRNNPVRDPKKREGEGAPGQPGETERDRAVKTMARGVTDCSIDTPFSPPIYISSKRPENTGLEDGPSSSPISQDPDFDVSQSPKIPDGKWSFSELRRAVKHCIGDDCE